MTEKKFGGKEYYKLIFSRSYPVIYFKVENGKLERITGNIPSRLEKVAGDAEGIYDLNLYHRKDPSLRFKVNKKKIEIISDYDKINPVLKKATEDEALKEEKRIKKNSRNREDMGRNYSTGSKKKK